MMRKRIGYGVPIYVPQLMLLNDGPVTITTMKLKIQLLAVEKAFAGARMRKPTISAGCRHKGGQPTSTETAGGATYVEPGHAEPADGEERVEDEEEHRGDDLRRRRVDRAEHGEQDHREHLPDGREEHEPAPPDAVDERDGDQRREEVFRAVARRDDARLDVVQAEAFEQQRRVAT